MGRVNQILQLVLKAVKDEGERSTTRDEILYYFNDVQRDISKRGFALEKKKTISLKVGTAVYSLHDEIADIIEVLEPSAWLSRLTFLHDVNAWADIVRQTGTLAQGASVYGIAIPSLGPSYGIIWKDKLELFPIPVLDEDLTLWVYVYASDIQSEDEEPDLDVKWDKALRLGVLAQVIGGDFFAQFETELAQQVQSGIKKVMKSPMRTEHSSDRLGF